MSVAELIIKISSLRPFTPADSISEEINFLLVFLHVGSGTILDWSWALVGLPRMVFGKQYGRVPAQFVGLACMGTCDYTHYTWSLNICIDNFYICGISYICGCLLHLWLHVSHYYVCRVGCDSYISVLQLSPLRRKRTVVSFWEGV